MSPWTPLILKEANLANLAKLATPKMKNPPSPKEKTGLKI